MAKRFKDKVLRECVSNLTEMMRDIRIPEAVQVGLRAEWARFTARVAEFEEDCCALEKRRAADRERARRRR